MSSDHPTTAKWVAGVDGCPAGWLVVFRSLVDDDHSACIVESIETVMNSSKAPCVVAVDIPIGFPTISVTGGCAAEREARASLGQPRGSSVFPRPSRKTLKATTFPEACDIEFDNSNPQKRMTQQAFNLFFKLKEIDLIAARYAGRLFECHPEVSFWVMNNRTAMCRSKATSSGREERRKHLQKHRYLDTFLTTRVSSAKEHALDDLLDACVAAWTAERIFRHKAIKFPKIAERLDDTGLEMAFRA